MPAVLISIHSLRMEGDISKLSQNLDHIIISIHSLRMEGDAQYFACRFLHYYFNPLPPHGGRRRTVITCTRPSHFNPLPPHGGRRLDDILENPEYIISIHSLRMEGDHENNYLMRLTLAFQSTPSAWRETAWSGTSDNSSPISIHSLRMEGDRMGSISNNHTFHISIHSLRMEGDISAASISFVHSSFQSTPSAWRETRHLLKPFQDQD